MKRFAIILLVLAGCAGARNDPQGEAFVDSINAENNAYRAMLGGQIDRGEISVEQANYLLLQKQNQGRERIERFARERADQPSVYPRAVTCRPDGYGGMRCR